MDDVAGSKKYNNNNKIYKTRWSESYNWNN